MEVESIIEPPLRIAVCGTSEPTLEQDTMAEAVGAALARNGAIVLCGGLGGVMESVCRGAQQEGGLTVGILPSGDAYSANRYVTLPIATGIHEARNAVIINSAEAMIAIGGGWGTLSEIAFARKAGIAIFGLHTWTTSDDVPLVEVVQTPEEAVDRAINGALKRRLQMTNGTIKH